MTSTGWTVPAPVAWVLERLPKLPPAWLFAQALNTVLAPRLDPELLAALAGRRVRLRVIDARVFADYTVVGNGFRALGGSGTPDVAISAAAWDFLQLARRAEDPDTLFFARRLVIEGDTELGLRLKNALDALDLPPLDASLLAPSRVFAHIGARFFLRSSPRRADPGV
ncbi:MAG: SCP2 sterol-binding domain-containing protein [Burkholderiales bacterium]|nr:SCP2 sterol-binding domain-containing protein [Burkholderiales bacterium]